MNRKKIASTKRGAVARFDQFNCFEPASKGSRNPRRMTGVLRLGRVNQRGWRWQSISRPQKRKEHDASGQDDAKRRAEK